MVDEDPMSIDDVEIRPTLETVGNIGEGSRQQHVVAVEEGHQIANNSSEAGVDPVRLSLVGDAAPRDAVAIALQNIDALVGRSCVLHVEEQVGIVLAEYACDRRAQEATLIEARRDDGDAGRPLRQRRRWRQRSQLERVGRMLLERPHRRTQPEPPEMRARSGIGLLELLMAIVESIESLLDRLEPLQEFFLFHQWVSGQDRVVRVIARSNPIEKSGSPNRRPGPVPADGSLNSGTTMTILVSAGNAGLFVMSISRFP